MHKPIEALHLLIGVWDCEEIFHPGGWVPNEVKASGVDTVRLGPGGSTTIADYVSDGGIGHYEAHDVTAWDENAKAYKFFFFDSFSSGFQVQTGRVEGNVAIFTSHESFNGKPGILRRTFKMGHTTQQLVVDFTDEAGNVTKFVTINKVRRAS
jgi:hypothetical protein